MTSEQTASAPTLNGHPPRENAQTHNEWQVVQLPVEHIVASPFQPRENFDETEIAELADSIRAYGVQQPIVVRRIEEEATNKGKSKPRFELVAGERRWRACRVAGRKTVPAIVRDLSDLAAAEICVLENVQRANLSVIEEARGYRNLALKFRLKEERIAKKVGKSVATIKDMLRLLALPEDVQKLLATRQLTAAHGHELLRLAPHPRICEAVAARIVRDKLTATSLASNPLPNAKELKKQNLITELGFGTKFDWRTVCAQCPHKAYVRDGYTSYCLRPDEWRGKQDAAIEMQNQEAVRVMEEAREQNGGRVEVERLQPGTYRSLAHIQLPAGCCEQCPCRSESCDAGDPMRRSAVCLNPKRFDELRDAQRKANEEVRKRRYTDEWTGAVENLQKDESGSNLVAALLVWPILRGENRSWVQPDAWRGFVRNIAAHLSIELPLDELLESQTEQQQGLKLLRDVPPTKLLVFAVSLTLAQEAERAVRFAGATPQLDFTLGREPASQTAFDSEDEFDLEEDVPDYDPQDVDYPDEMEE